MCLNAWGGRLYTDLLPYLTATAPDVLCLQEVVHTPGTDQDWLTYRDGDFSLPQRANFFRDVCTALPDHTALFCPAAQGVLWEDETSVPSQWGLATFVHKSIPIIGQIQDFVHKCYVPGGYGAHPRPRNAHGVRLYDYTSNRTVSLTHMHGLRDLKGKMDTPERMAQAHKLLEISQRLTAPEDICVICGDFNVMPDSQTLVLLKHAGLTELVTSKGITSTRSSHYPKPGRFADYMLINDEKAVRAFNVIYEPEVSDHCPLILEI